jgi:hypothetical protein
MEKYIEYITSNSSEMILIESKLGNLMNIPPLIINSIMENYELFADVSEIEMFLTWKPAEALDHPYNKGVVVYFEQIKLYCATDQVKYLELSEKLFNKKYNLSRDEIIDDMISNMMDSRMELTGKFPTTAEINEIRESEIYLKSVNMKQIVLTTDKQKIVFAFNSDDGYKLNKFCKILDDLTEEKFKTIKSSNIFELTMMNKLFNSKLEADQYVDKLKIEINKINKEFGELMGVIKPIKLFGNFEYCAHDISIIVENPTTKQISEILKTVPRVNNLIFNSGTIISSHFGNGNINASTDDLQSLIKKWIIDNPIDGKITPQKHVKLFNEQNNTKLSVNQWGKYVRDLVNSFKSNGVKYYKNK